MNNTNENNYVLYQFLSQKFKNEGKTISIEKFNQYYKNFINTTSSNDIKTIPEYNSRFLNYVFSIENNLETETLGSNILNNKMILKDKRKLLSQNQNDKIRNSNLEDYVYDKNFRSAEMNPYFQPQIGNSTLNSINDNKFKNNESNNNNNNNKLNNENFSDNFVEIGDSKNIVDSKKNLDFISSENCGPNKKFISNEKKINKLDGYQTQFSIPEKLDYNQDINPCNVCEQSVYIICNSRDRDVTKFPFHDYFQVEFSQPIKNIKEIKCQHVTLPNLNYFEFEPFLFLQIPEIDQLFGGTQNFYSNMFAQILPTCVNHCQRFITCFPAKTKKKYYNQPIASLSRLTFRLCTSNGNPLHLPTDVFQISNIENCVLSNSTVYKITMINQARNHSECFFNWLKSVCRLFDPIFVTGVPEIRQQLLYLDFERYDDYNCPNIILYACSYKIPIDLLPDLNFSSTLTVTNNCFCSFNKMTITVLLKFKILDLNNNLIHSQIVK
jgi:hypothetical protein